MTCFLLMIFAASKPHLGVGGSEKRAWVPINTADDLLLVESDLEAELTTTELREQSPYKLPTPTVIPQVASSIVSTAKEKFSVPQEVVSVPEVSLSTQETAVKINTSHVPDNVDNLITKYADEYNADPARMTEIARCESGFRPDAVSPSGKYVGMYQFHANTWVSNREAMGLDSDPALRANTEEAIKTAAFKMGRDGYGAWPVCSQL